MQATCMLSRPVAAVQQPAASRSSRHLSASRSSSSSSSLARSRPASSRKQPRSSVVVASATLSGLVEKVGDVMTAGSIITCGPDTTVDDALELLVEHRVTGLPVCDATGKVVGVVSDFDLLALEGIGQKEKEEGLFPTATNDWDTFFEVQKLIQKNEGKIVADVMTPDPICVRANTSIEDAANLLLRMKIRRLPVVDENGKLLGIISRGNIIAAALRARKAGRQ